MTTHRPERVGDLIRQALARALREAVRDPRIGFVTLTDVKLSPDLKHARVFISTLGGEAEREEALRALRRAAPFLRKTLARQTGLRHVPRLDFQADDTLETGARVEQLIAEIREGRDPEGEDPER